LELKKEIYISIINSISLKILLFKIPQIFLFANGWSKHITGYIFCTVYVKLHGSAGYPNTKIAVAQGYLEPAIGNPICILNMYMKNGKKNLGVLNQPSCYETS